MLSCSALVKRFPAGPDGSKDRFWKSGFVCEKVAGDEEPACVVGPGKAGGEASGGKSSSPKGFVLLVGGFGNRSLFSKGFVLSFDTAGEFSVDDRCRLHHCIDICL